ncbi:MAG: tetratricopeptide repeat protein [Actinobacteria bacterium]|nr:tetratricopeptide repeat protein [Actinomycetota bacterium]
MPATNASQNSNHKYLFIAAALVVIIAIGAYAIIGNNDKNGTEQAKVSKEEAAKAREKGLDFYKKGDWDSALDEFERAVAGNPGDLYALMQLAYTYERKGQLDEAFQQYEALLNLDAKSADAHYNMGRILVQKKELDKAIVELETAAKMNADFTAVRADLAEAYVRKKEFEKALATYAELEKIITVSSSDNIYLSHIFYAKGDIYKRMGQRANAKAMFTKALELNENNKDASTALIGLK